MSCKTIMWVAVAGLLLAGCGGKDSVPTGQEEYEKYFGKKFRVPSDRSVKISANVRAASHEAGGEIGLNLMMSNMAKTGRTLPLGVETDDGMVYTYLEALVRHDGGTIEHVDFTADGGELVAVDFGEYETVTRDFYVSDYYAFDTPGKYEVVLFYSVKDETLPDGSTPDWTGTVWTSPITIVVE